MMKIDTVGQKLIDLARGRLRHTTFREQIEAEFSDFIGWLKANGVENPYIFFEKSSWDFIRFQIYWSTYNQAKQRAEQLNVAENQLLERLKAPDSKSLILAGVAAWSKQERELLSMLVKPALMEETPAVLTDESPIDVEA